ncbi:MAG: DinB family protein [Pyrinomonadaceae bacterium]
MLNTLDNAHNELLTELSEVDDQLFSLRPTADQWSVAEVIDHLSRVELAVIQELQKGLDRPAARVSVFKRLIPMQLVSLRLFRVEAPKLVKPLNTKPKQESLSSYSYLRDQLKTLCEAQEGKRFRQISMRHPVFGMIDGVAAITMVAHHERRHLKQVRDILKTLRTRSAAA